jgi:hypothetical protein
MSTTDDVIDKWDPKRLIIWITRAVTYVAYAYILFVEVILALGFLLKLFGANDSASFVQWAYRNLDRVMEPFRGIFSPIELGTPGNSEVPAEFETSILFAMVIYGIVALVIHIVIQWLTHRIEKLDRDARAAAQREEYDRATAELEARRAAAGLPPTNPAPVVAAVPPTVPPVAAPPIVPGTPGAPGAPHAPVAPAPTRPTPTTPPPPPPPS